MAAKRVAAEQDDIERQHDRADPDAEGRLPRSQVPEPELKISIPSIVNTFIGLYKDTTLVLIIGMLDPLGIGKASLADAVWSGLAREVYLFIALFFFICCFSMSRYSLYLERKLATGH